MRRLVFGLGAAQIGVSAVVNGAIAYAFGNSLTAATIFGLSLVPSLTALVMQLPTETKRLGTSSGRTGFGVLLFLDLAVVPILFLVSVAGAEVAGSLARLTEVIGACRWCAER